MPPKPAPLAAALPLLPIGDSDVPGVKRVLALANNENVEAPSPAVCAAIADAARTANRYPDITALALRQSLSRHFPGIAADQMLVGVGAGELIALLAQAYCAPGDEVIIGAHGYLYFAIASQAVGARVVRAAATPGRNAPGFDVDAALNAVTARTRVVFVDNPANPLGTYVDHDGIRRLREGLPEDVVLVFDCAYAEYATAPDFDCGDELVRSGDNTVVIRTFSKVYGLAGMRVGWAHAPAPVLEAMRRVQRPGNFSSPSLAGAIAALEEQDRIAERVARNHAVRAHFSAALRDFGLDVTPSQANFVLVTVPNDAHLDARGLHDALAAEGILVRDMGPYALPHSLRISLGSAADMDEVREATQRLLRVR